jgi:hypothetical protein
VDCLLLTDNKFMAISYPLTLPTTPGFSSIDWAAKTVVGINVSPFTGQQQTYVWPGQWWECTATLPPMSDLTSGAWHAFFLSLNGMEGSFMLGDSIRKTPLGSVTGTLTVGSGAVANTTTLPISGATGTFAVGDWIQVGSTSTARLHKVTQVNSSISVDVFPRLRSAYASGTAITTNNAKGVFRLSTIPNFTFDSSRIINGVTLNAIEVLT